MKKYLSLILALVMAFSLCACSGDDDSPTLEGGATPTTQTGDSSNTSVDLSQFKGRMFETTAKLLASGSYIYEFSDGTQTMTYTTVGGKGFLSFTANNVQYAFLQMNNQYYIVFNGDKAYTELTDSTNYDGLTKNYVQTLFNQLLVMENCLGCSFKGTGSATVGTETFTYEDYYNPINQGTIRFFFDANGNLTYMSNGDTNASMYTVSVMTATSSTFDALNEYTLVSESEIAAEMAKGTTAQ